MIEQVSETTLLFTGETDTYGLHTRSAALVIRWTAGLDAHVTVERLDGHQAGKGMSFACKPPSTGSFILLSSMGVRPGERLKFTARGPDARAALYGIKRALEEEPPPNNEQRLVEWWGRVRGGVPEGADLAELDEELNWMVAVSAREDAVEVMDENWDLYDYRIREALVNAQAYRRGA